MNDTTRKVQPTDIPVPLDLIQRVVNDTFDEGDIGILHTIIENAPSFEMGGTEIDGTLQATHFLLKEAPEEEGLRVPLSLVEIHETIGSTEHFELSFFKAENGRWKVTARLGANTRTFAMPVTKTFVAIARNIHRACQVYRMHERAQP